MCFDCHQGVPRFIGCGWPASKVECPPCTPRPRPRPRRDGPCGKCPTFRVREHILYASTHRHVCGSSRRSIMDADIQDILDSVSAPSLSQRTLDLQALTRAWVNERTAPELLPYPASLVDRIMDRIKKQVSATGSTTTGGKSENRRNR